jgi:outer membrane receptor for ferrienterochelin and colicins
MRFALIVVFVFICCIATNAQQVLEAYIKDAETRQPMPGATVKLDPAGLGASADENGYIRIEQVPAGTQTVTVSFLGYVAHTIILDFSEDVSTPYEILLKQAEKELEEIVITSTRSSRTIADIPTRVELIAGEELDEKSNMKPGDIRMLLSESTGIQTQQTSPTSANASIRIQGLDGRYTQILKDGFPLYAGFSAGLGLLQIPPLDLKQVEVIKGSSSTLYGGGAIAGLVNLISKTPSEERELKLLVNGTSARGLDMSGFFAKKIGNVGVTVFAARNSGEPYDPADIDLTAIPKFERYTINPRLFMTVSERTEVVAGLNLVTEDRIGGDIHYVEGDGNAIHRYFEDNESRRYSTQLSLSHKLGSATSINLKNSFGYFDRRIATPDNLFDGRQNSSYTEVNIVNDKGRIEWIAGVNLITDKFKERMFNSFPLRNYSQTTVGAFVQNTSTLNKNITIETGLRGDYVNDYGFALLPRISVLFKTRLKFTSRLGGGLGYKAPTIFTEESERLQYQNVLPISHHINRLERSYGANWDLNYRTQLGELTFTINHLFFYTYLNHPLALSSRSTEYEFQNLSGYIETKGTETNLKIEYGDFKLFIGYTFTDTEIHDQGTSIVNPLTAKHRLNNVLMYEVEEKWKVGLEGYYFGKQRLSDNTYGKDYWICGFMIEKLWENFSVFINFENFLDARQTRFDTIYTGSISDPVFRDIYAPVDGFVINGGFKVNL